MAKPPTSNLTKLDGPALQNFIDHDLADFVARIKELRAPGGTPLAMYDIASASGRPLILGNMEGDDNTGGKSVVSNTKTAAGAIDDVLGKHEAAFTQLGSELHGIITKTLNAKGENLTAIESQKFLSSISGYETNMGDTGAGPNLSPTGGSSNTT